MIAFSSKPTKLASFDRRIENSPRDSLSFLLSKIDNHRISYNKVRPMSSILPPRPRHLGAKVRICIVASKYNEEFTDALVENAIDELGELMPNSRVDLIRVPGAFEIPVTVSQIIQRDAPVCIIALGLIIRGATAHADLVAESVTSSLQSLAVNHRVPIIHEVLLVDDEKQAYARCIGAALNRGREAARVATSMIDIFQELDRSIPRTSSRPNA
ncbi:MAG: 6,7-dimethyl-8-ribityllumazine synthase [Verrucomicrobiota bacterium]